LIQANFIEANAVAIAEWKFWGNIKGRNHPTAWRRTNADDYVKTFSSRCIRPSNTAALCFRSVSLLVKVSRAFGVASRELPVKPGTNEATMAEGTPADVSRATTDEFAYPDAPDMEVEGALIVESETKVAVLAAATDGERRSDEGGARLRVVRMSLVLEGVEDERVTRSSAAEADCAAGFVDWLGREKIGDESEGVIGGFVAWDTVELGWETGIFEAASLGLKLIEIVVILGVILEFGIEDKFVDWFSPDAARRTTVGFAWEDEEEVGIEPAGRSSALMISAASRKISDISGGTKASDPTFSATPYTTACRCAAGIMGNILASTILRFCVPHTRKCESTTPPCSSGSIASVPLGWNSVRRPLFMTWLMASSFASMGGTNWAACSSSIGGVARICRLKNNASTKTCLSTGLDNHRGSMAGGWNGSADWIWHVPRENGCMTATVRLPALLLIISYAAVVVLANRAAKDCFCAV